MKYLEEIPFSPYPILLLANVILILDKIEREGNISAMETQIIQHTLVNNSWTCTNA